ncbi:mRNA-binding ribosome synthesis protein nop7 [Vanrija albida]|uniref:Pescadillo homolog n=1 Tax=Vanrija albida TaxID=181172 RepID=A0ABR3QD24_9TREE
MAKIKKRGESGAAKNYITRNKAVNKLQISLSDFRRLCILKGIYPREPLHKKRANKGSSAPASFYYYKDIQYLLHEPLLAKFREHKAFAKKLARAVGRQEWGLAKNLEASKPVTRLDHLVKERYPTFTLALQDLQDPLNLVHLFSTLPTNPIPGKTIVPTEVIAECSRLINEWKVWAIRTHSLRKVFLGVKGVYYEAEVPGHGGDLIKVRWLEGYEFQQHVPHDVDFRILLTFLELYRTLIGFVLFKLYTEENLVYPPPLDVEQDAAGETVGAFRLVENKATGASGAKGVSKKAVKRAIQGLAARGVTVEDEDVEMEQEVEAEEEDEDFVERPSKAAEVEDVGPAAPLPTYTSLVASSAPSTSRSQLLFAPYTFYLSRETSSRTWEFVIRALGGKVVTSLTAPSLDNAPSADSITHVLIDRPMTDERRRELEAGRKWTWVQPQWVADCVNRGKVLATGEYAPGQLLPPHLSPWDGEGEQERPWLGIGETTEGAEEGAEEAAEEEEESEDDDEEADEDESAPEFPPALLESAKNPSDASLLHAAELEAEANGTSHAAFKAQLKEATKLHGAAAKAQAKANGRPDEDLRKIMMSNKKAKLYEKMKYSNAERVAEHEKLETRRKEIAKRKRKEAKAGK